MNLAKRPQKKTDKYSKKYSESSFWTKIKNYAKSAGKEVIEKALILYFCLKDPDTPAWAKSVIIGTLGYFILPMDSIPDLTPFIGFSDDLGALAAALGIVGFHIKKVHREMAIDKMDDWF